MNVLDESGLIDKILEIELEMFLAVPSGATNSCQQTPEQVLLHRRVQFEAWDGPTLHAYLNDLQRASNAGVNLMTMKYALMDNLIEIEEDIPLVSQISERLLEWQKEIFKRYPILMKDARPFDDDRFSMSFKTYLESELKTYSIHTLQCLLTHINTLAEQQKNMSEIIYTNLVRLNGYNSIDHYIELLAN